MALHHVIARHLKGSGNLSDRRRNILGQQGEDLAVQYLLKVGYRIIERNYRNYYGEIDIIANEPKSFVFVEVKTRRNVLFSHPCEAVTRKKQIKISKVAMAYMTENNLTEVAARFDVVAILLPDDTPPKIDLIQNAFDLSDAF
ncbi:MAG: YraN family protein [Proteobacteria bacterium]|nr:YraN family protein [Pseudomonadota bacterium]MBU1648313.1 YraN family protein [Pseudomonadota bacterium]MBU1986756.1 YraN family protein [Pseudomonadota bacterium]